MTTKELEELLEGGRETPRIEYKGPMGWNIDTFAKDILALSNIKNGGYIIIGMKETEVGYQRKGVSREQKGTFKIDIMRDQISSVAVPPVDFSVDFPLDKNGLQFVVIKIYEFKEIPTICIKDSHDTKSSTIYYRNTGRRVESAPISNYHDLRDLLERATSKIRKRWSKLGLILKEELKEKLDRELGDLK